MKRIVLLLFCGMLLAFVPAMAQDYASYDELTSHLQTLTAEHGDLLTLESIGKSTAGKDIWLVTLAAGGEVKPGNRPAVFVGGNIEGYRLTATAAALSTLDYLVENKDEEVVAALLSTRTFYIAPVLNPDLMILTMEGTLGNRRGNLRPINDDSDDEIDEDGAEDLNGDGFITKMRYMDAEGTMLIDEQDARLMHKADPMKEEVGEYKIITEGVDNDGDGSINEDGPGGTVLNMNFPHDYPHFKTGAGPHPASEPVVVAVLDFFFAHKNIAAVYSFGEESNLLNLKRGKGTAKAGSDMVKINRQFARFLNLEEGQEMHIDELVELIKQSSLGSRMEVTRERVLQFLGTGPALNIQNRDYPYYEKAGEWFVELRKELELGDYADKPKPVMGDGSFVSWAYYHFGVPAFASSVWELPKLKEEKKEDADELTVAKIKVMSSEDFVALGEEKIDAFLKSRGSEQRVTAKQLISMVEGGQVTPDQMAKMMEARDGEKKDEKKEAGEEAKQLDWMAENLPNSGFVTWQPFNHPTLGEVEIGGRIPLATVNPPYSMINGNLDACARFTLKIAESLATIELVNVKATRLEEGVYEITAMVANRGYFPTAFAQGALNSQVQPVLVRLEGDGITLLSGAPMHRFNSIGGLSNSSKMRWVVKLGDSNTITLNAHSEKSGSDTATLTLR